MKNILFATLIGTITCLALAAESPYAGHAQRNIKALSQQEIDGYLAGEGMGYAMAAELNHYPGPKHVLELAAELGLSPQQREWSQEIYDAMKARAIALGTQLVEKERALDRMFADGTVDAVSLTRAVTEIGLLQAQIRLAHLSAHLEEKALLDERQIERYDQLRGYRVRHEGGYPESQ